MATVTTNTVQPVSTGDYDYEKELKKVYGHTGDGKTQTQAQTQNAAAGSGTVKGSVNTGNINQYLNDMYDASLESQKQQLQSNYETNVSNLEAEKAQAQREHEQDVNRAYVESYKKAKNFNEVQNAYGLTSGAMGQAALAQDNQMLSTMADLRQTQQLVDAEIERQRSILAKEYSAAIAKAQADNDFQRAQALLERAQLEEERMLQKQKELAELAAQYGDYSLLLQYYGVGGGYGGYSMGGVGGSSGGGEWTTAAGNPKYTNPSKPVSVTVPRGESTKADGTVMTEFGTI